MYLGLTMLEISKIVMCEFCTDYVKPKYEEKVKLCYIDTDSFIVYRRHLVDIAKDAETRFDNSDYELERPLLKGKIRQSTWINEIWISWENNDRVWHIETENI